ncbi:MAG TPA: prolipoprotein diacylglyceryl transferase [Cyclobacteriaceae bacterium]|nr:prolipoprotein diacylglyceryl transferase [Cyclobacteriaceae bacterium]
MELLGFIIWSANPEILPNSDWIHIRWYGLLFALAFIAGQQIYYYFYKTEGKSDKDVETLLIYLVVGTIIGARLGHVLFYEPDRFLTNPLEILKIWKGGLASHGAAIGILTCVYIYSNYLVKINFREFIFRKRKREGQGFLYVMDRIVIVAALGGAFIRFGNFVNSEIIGVPTGSGGGVLFARDVIDQLEFDRNIGKASISYSSKRTLSGSDGNPVDIIIEFGKGIESESTINTYLQTQIKQVLVNSSYVNMHIEEPPDTPLNYDLTRNKNGNYEARIHTFGIPRHPAQLYEAISCIILFLLIFYIWQKGWKKLAEGRIFGIFLIILFSLRFLYEFLKENQVEFENNMALNMGQWLSIPLILFGLYLLLRKGPAAQPDPSE